MHRDRDYYSLLKEVREVKDLLGEVLRRLGNIELHGVVKYGIPNHVSEHHEKFVDIRLTRKDKQDKVDGNKVSKKLHIEGDEIVSYDIHGNPYNPRVISDKQYDFSEGEE